MVGASVGNGDGWDVGYEVVGFDDGFGVGGVVGAADGCVGRNDVRTVTYTLHENESLNEAYHRDLPVVLVKLAD